MVAMASSALCAVNLHPASVFCRLLGDLSVIGDDMFLLVRIIARDESQGRFSGAKIDRLVRYVGFNINEISFLTDDRILQLLAVARIHPAFEQEMALS
jgi:hypothetical protein